MARHYRKTGANRPTWLGAAGLLFCLMATSAQPGIAQDRTRISGLAFVDYYYWLASPEQDREGAHGFEYRRLYLTVDHEFSERVEARARLEVQQDDIYPFVKDLYLSWRYAGDHLLRLGVQSPPVYDVSEDVWNYRSLEATIMDRNDVAESRDMGLQAEGPLLPNGWLRYAVMVGNNNDTEAENDRYKRMYAQLQAFPTDGLTFTLGGDYAAYPDPRTSGTTFNAFAGYEGSAFRAGIEGFRQRIGRLEGGEEEVAGVSLFGSLILSDRWEVVGRFDRLRDAREAEYFQSLFIAALTYQPTKNVRFMPNLYWVKEDTAEKPDLAARFTLEFNF